MGEQEERWVAGLVAQEEDTNNLTELSKHMNTSTQVDRNLRITQISQITQQPHMKHMS